MAWKGQADARTELMINKIISLATATEKDCCEGAASNRAALVYKPLHGRWAVCLIAVFFSTFLFTDICLTGDLTNQQLHFYEMVSLHFTGENLIYKLKDVFFFGNLSFMRDSSPSLLFVFQYMEKISVNFITFSPIVR